MLICEGPWLSQRVGLLARKDGKYIRPIIGGLVDIRLEDFMPRMASTINIIGRLPDIPEIDQIGRYFVSVHNVVDDVNLTETDVEKHLQTGDFTLLPHNPNNEYWNGSPWWEYAMVLDQYNSYIKAPKEYRPDSEPSPEEIDEQLDNYEENKNKLDVISPQTIEGWAKVGIAESYITKLDAIFKKDI